jgi:hypothetical protein
MANAANPREVRGRDRLFKKRERRFLNALRAVLETPEGRIVFGERDLGIIARAGVYRSIWSPNAEIHYKAGRQDFGHELLGLLIAAGEDLYLVMEAEMRGLARRDSGELEATELAANEGASQ